LARHPNVTFHCTPTHGCWLNQIEIWFSILSRQALRGKSFSSVRELRQGVDGFISVYNDKAAPFEWKKAVVHPGKLRKSHAGLFR
jgi:transposase